MSYTIPIGSFRPALEEPFKIKVVREGEVVRDAWLHTGFNFRGIEWLAQKRNYVQNIALFERVCGICSNVHTLTSCTAVECLAKIEVLPRAHYIRVIIAELERLHSHILWAGAAAHVMGFQTLFMTCFILRESVMDALKTISGNRVNYAMNCVGGVKRDITDPEAILATVRKVKQALEEQLIPIFTTDLTVHARCAGVDVMSKEQAVAWCSVGPTARAHGLNVDIRKAAPYAAYDQLELDVPTQISVDVLARIIVRAFEMRESCHLIE